MRTPRKRTQPTPAPEPEGPSPERRFVQRKIVQPLIQWMPLGGAGGAFASFLLKQDWMLALLMFPVTIVTAVWAAYSKNFIEQLSEIYADRAKADAKGLVSNFDRWNDSLTEALKWQFSGFEGKYLECQRLDCHEDNPAGFKDEPDRGIFTPLLRDVFVPLRLNTYLSQAGYGAEYELTQQQAAEMVCKIVTIWEVLQAVRREPIFRQIAIRAWGGYGKTTLLKHVAYTYACGLQRKHGAPKLVPFLLYLSRCWQHLTAKGVNAKTLPEVLTDYHLKQLPKGAELEPPPNWARELLRRGEALVMWDGFDEVPPGQRGAVSEWLSAQMRDYPEAVFMVTSRPRAYVDDYTARQPTAPLAVQPFEPQQQRRFVEQWYLCQERLARGGRATADVKHWATQKTASLLAQLAARPELAALAGNPLLLNMMCRFHRDGQREELPRRRVDLYQDICELQLSRRPKARSVEMLLGSMAQRQEVLQSVALVMMLRATTDGNFKEIEEADLLDQMAAALAERDRDVAARDFLRQIVDVSELLVQREQGIYEFAHLSFQEFLAAAEVARLNQEALLYDYFELPTWKPTILLYGELKNPTNLIRQAIARGATQLAYEIFQSTSKRLDLSATEVADLDRLRATVQNSRYAKLEEFLQQGQWEAADKETYRLMITTVGKEEGDWFDREEVLNFPCEELLAIDGLWVRYSQGKFGFSVQKQIYVECGAKLDGSYPGNEIWERFGDRVGWRVKGNWQNYSDLSKNLNISLKGELPGVGELGGWCSWGGALSALGLCSSLASRLVNCSRPQS